MLSDILRDGMTLMADGFGLCGTPGTFDRDGVYLPGIDAMDCEPYRERCVVLVQKDVV